MTRNELITNYRFLFFFGALRAGFQKISNLGGKINVEYIYEGGRFDCAYPIRGSKGTSGKLILEKGFGSFNPFYGFSGFEAGMRIQQACDIVILGEDNTAKRTFTFDNGLIASWECSAIDALRNEILIDKIEIEHTGLYEINLASSVKKYGGF